MSGCAAADHGRREWFAQLLFSRLDSDEPLRDDEGGGVGVAWGWGGGEGGEISGVGWSASFGVSWLLGHYWDVTTTGSGPQ